MWICDIECGFEELLVAPTVHYGSVLFRIKFFAAECGSEEFHVGLCCLLWVCAIECGSEELHVGLYC